MPSDSSESSSAPPDCSQAMGGGCGPAPASVDCIEDTGDTADSGQGFSDIEGGGCGCATGPTPLFWWPLWVLVLAVWRRRVSVAGVVALGVASPARALDVDLFQPGDGGRFVSLLDTDPGTPWSPRVALTGGVANDPVIVQNDVLVTSLVDDVQRVELGASLPLGEQIRVALAAPYIWSVAYDGVVQPPMMGVPRGAVSIHTKEGRIRHAWEVELSANQRNPVAARYLLGDPGAIAATWAFSRTSGPVVVGGELGASFRGETELPGVTVSRQGHFGAAVAWEPWERVPTSLELLGRTPMASGTGRVGWPAEVLATAGRRTETGWALRAGAGFGITNGVGAPNWRAFAMAERSVGVVEDVDGDGIANLRDLCRRQPEDFDGFHDGDGCPDLDNDLDSIPDTEDLCPNEPEVRNGHADADGCPDELVVLTVRVLLPGLSRGTQAWLRVDGGGASEEMVVFHDDPVTVRLPDGMWLLRAGAVGHTTVTERVAVAHSAERSVVLELEAQPVATLVVRADHALTGEALAADVAVSPIDCPSSVEGGTAAVAAGEELTVDLAACDWDVQVSAPGFEKRRATVSLRSGRESVLRLRLAPREVHTVGSELRLDAPLLFGHDQAVLPPDAGPRLDALAEWLAERVDVVLLRIEGRADELGDAAYNLALSNARAEAVCAGLVERGVAPERLQALGSGEAFAVDPGAMGSAPGAGLDRQVRFVMLVWDRTAEP